MKRLLVNQIGFFGRFFGFYGACCSLAISSFFLALFFIGDPSFSLSVMFVCFIFLCWNFFRLIQKDLSYLHILALTIFTTFIYYICGEFIFFILLAIKSSICFLIFTFFLSFFRPKMIKFAKISFVAFLVSIFSLGLFLGVIKLYFFDAAVFFTSNQVQDYPLLFSDIPSNVYLSLRDYDFLGIQKDALFVLDFSDDSTLNDFSVQLGRFNQTRHLFHYEFQLLCLDSSWFPFHLTLVFI